MGAAQVLGAVWGGLRGAGEMDEQWSGTETEHWVAYWGFLIGDFFVGFEALNLSWRPTELFLS